MPKFSTYDSATTPLAGTEVLLVKQGSDTTKTTVQDIANLAAASVLTAKVSVTSAEILAMFTTPKTLVTAPGAGKVIKVLGINIRLNYGTAAYAANTNLRVKTGLHDPLLTATSYLGQTANAFTNYMPASAVNTADFADVANQPCQLYVQTGNPTTGDGTLDVYVTYTVITL